MTAYSVVVPVYNSQDTLEELYSQLQSFFSEAAQTFEVVFVDDCSTDNSWGVIEKLQGEHKGITGVKLSKNSGQHHATSCGILHTRGQQIITIDDDLQIKPAEIKKLILRQAETGADVVYGIYPQKKHSFVRNWGSRLFEAIFKKYAQTISKGSSFKLIKEGIARKVAAHHIKHLYIDEIINWYTHRITTVEVEHHPRQYGRSGYTLFGLVFMSLNYIVNYTILPLRLMTYLGFFSSLISFVIGLYFIYRKIFFGAELGFTALITAIFFSTGILLFCFGIIGEYIRRLFDVTYNKPTYNIEKVLASSD